MTAPRSYTASAGILIDFNVGEVQPSNLVSRTSEVFDSVTDSHLLLLKSPRLARRVIEKLQLQDDPKFGSDDSNSFLSKLASIDLLSFLNNLGSSEQPEHTIQWENIIDAFLSNTTVERLGKTYVLTISYQSQDPGKAAEIANEIATTHIASLHEEKQTEARQALKWLQSRIAEVRDELYNAEIRLQTAGLDTMSVRDLEITVHALKTNYQNLQDRYNITTQQASSPFVEARIVTPATAPLRPSHPRRTLILFGTLILGSSVGLLLAYLRDVSDPYVRATDQVERATGAECFCLTGVSAAAKSKGSGQYSRLGDDALQDIVTRILIAGQLGQIQRVGVTAVDRSTAKSVVAARLGELLALVEGPPPSRSTIDQASVNPDKSHDSEQQRPDSPDSVRKASGAGPVSPPQGLSKGGIIIVDLPSLDSGGDAVQSVMAVDACVIVVTRHVTRLASLKTAMARFRFPPGFILGSLMTRT
jgi:capsular polysaccharide biosynthesis protein